MAELKKHHGPQLVKYFFDVMPFVSATESQKDEIFTANLRLFHIATQFNMMDSKLLVKFRTFVKSK